MIRFTISQAPVGLESPTYVYCVIRFAISQAPVGLESPTYVYSTFRRQFAAQFAPRYPRLVISGRRSYRRHLPHFQQDNRTYYITFVTQNRWVLPPLARDLVLRHILFDDQRKMHLHTAIVMPDHVHMLMTPFWNESGDTFGLAWILKGIKGSSARTVNLALGRKGTLWLDESFDHELRSNESIQQKSEYIAMNPVRAGLVATPDEYPWLWRESIDRSQPQEGVSLTLHSDPSSSNATQNKT